MLTDEIKKAAMEKLDNMTAEDFITAFERIGSVRAEAEPDLMYAIDRELKALSSGKELADYFMLSNNSELDSSLAYFDSDSIILAA